MLANHQHDNASSRNTFKFWDEEKYLIEVIPKVPLFVRETFSSDDYDPLVVSFGPYHHGHSRLQLAEELKPEIYKSFVNHTSFDEQLLLNEVLKVIDDLRGSYAKGSTDMYDDNLFARMMLLDAAFAVEHIIDQLAHPLVLRDDTLKTRFHRSIVGHITRDLYVLENQIPFWFLKVMVHMRYGKNKREGNKLLNNFLNWTNYRNIEDADQGSDSAHLVDAVRTLVIGGGLSLEDYQITITNKFQPQLTSKIIQSFHSVTRLKAKGIHIRRSESNSIKDVSFCSGFFFSTLRLPAAVATVSTRSVYSNIIAYEMSPQKSREHCIVTAYINFMKSLIESPKDAKELQDKGVIKSMLGSDDEVVKLYKNIYTFGIDCSTVYEGTVYEGVIEEIEHHNSKGSWSSLHLLP